MNHGRARLILETKARKTRSRLVEGADIRKELERHHAESFGWALHCCARDRAEAEDVLQTAYLKVLEGKARFDGRSAFKTWLFSVIRRTAADLRRRHWLRRLGLERYTRETEIQSAAPDMPAATDGELVPAFAAALAALPRRQREVLHLVFYQQLTVEEAAGVMGVGLGSARTHYARAKARLRSWFGDMERVHEC